MSSDRLDFPDDIKVFLNDKGEALERQSVEVSRLVSLFNEEHREGLVLMPTHVKHVSALIESTEPMDYLEIALMFMGAHYAELSGFDINLELFQFCRKCQDRECGCSKFQRFKQKITGKIEGYKKWVSATGEQGRRK